MVFRDIFKTVVVLVGPQLTRCVDVTQTRLTIIKLITLPPVCTRWRFYWDCQQHTHLLGILGPITQILKPPHRDIVCAKCQVYMQLNWSHSHAPDIVAEGTKLAVRIAQSEDHRGNSYDKVVPTSSKSLNNYRRQTDVIQWERIS